jgi:NAD(P)-dependent dehydrogenase (short-subunit alcohol dehydrogenase family)
VLAKEVAPLGITVLVVEPGSFRTRLFDATTASAEIDDYLGTVGPTRAMTRCENGRQPGDPAKAAAAILAALDADRTPFRLPLGPDAVDAILAQLDGDHADIAAWETLSRDTDLDSTED